MSLEEAQAGFGDSSAALVALNAVRHFVGLLSPDGVLLEANTAALVAGGLSREDVIGLPFWDAHWWSHDPEVQAELRAAISRAAKGERARYDLPVRAANAGRDLVTIDFSLTPLVDDEGRVRYLVPEGHPLDDIDDGSVSISWAELVAEANRARSESEQLRSLASALAAVHGVDAVARVIVDRLPELHGFDLAAVAVLDEDGSVTLRGRSDLDGEVAQRWSRLALADPTPVTDAIRTGTDIVLTDRAELSRRYPTVAAATSPGLECLVAHAVVDATGAPQAAIGLGSTEPGGCRPEQYAALVALCGAALQRAIAVERVVKYGALLDTLIRSAPVGFALLDGELRFGMVNEVLAEFNGIPAPDHLGRTVSELVPDVAAQVVPLLEQVLHTGESLTGVHVTGTTAASTEPRTWEESYYPVTTPAGAVLGIGAIAQDITERLTAERELASLNERLQLALRISGAGVFQWSPDTGAIEWTGGDSHRFGIDPSVPLEIRRWLALVHPDDRDQLVETMAGLLEGASDWDHEFRIVTPQRGTRWVHSVALAHRRRDGNVSSVVGLTTDITERKQREIELAELHARQRRVAERLQNGLLPAVLPDIDGYEISVRYQPGTDGLRIGGDWYDVIPVADDDVALVVGDVVGHDLDAAIAMAQLRNATVGLSYAHSHPAEVVSDLDQLCTLDRSLVASTMFYGRLNPRTGELRYVLAGHHRPLLMSPGRAPVLHEAPAATPLGVPSARDVGELVLGSCDLLVAYTDGLLEHRGEPISAGQRRLLELASRADPGIALTEFTRHLVSDVPPPDRRDDIAVLALRRS